MRFLLAIALLALSAAPAAAQQPSLLHAMFQDHAVLQRDQPIAVWGWAPPRAQVVVTLGTARRVVRADRAGVWRANLPAMPAGGPYELIARTPGAEQRASDVMVGDVFLCSGQSNMAWPVSLSLNPLGEMANATDSSIRLMQIAQTSAPTPQLTFVAPVQWQVLSPETVGGFPGACYFFARELKRAGIDVPMGLINASWGGTNIRSWMSAPALRAVGGYEAQLDVLDQLAVDEHAAIAGWGETWQAWWAENVPNEREPWAPGAGADWTEAPETLDVFTSWGVPELERFVGMVWHRAAFTLTAEQAAQGAVISLGVIDEIDQTWLNGRLIGATGDWSAQRLYAVPPGLLRQGENVVVVNVLNSSGQGGIRGPLNIVEARLANGDAIPLRNWRYRASAAPHYRAPRAPWEALGGLTSIGNAMIAPIGPYRMRGALWYQGESNAGAPGDYEALLAGLFADWRGQFGADLPVLVAQLPNWNTRYTAPAEAGWASIRDAQRRAVAADARAGLAVLIDAGDAADLHPPNKQIVGRRLAQAGRHVIYGEDVHPSGPEVRTAAREGGAIVVSFAAVTERLVAYNGAGPNAFELCSDAAGTCRFVEARIDGARVLLPDAADATRVRYCWGDAPVCTLYDMSGLPAGPFELSIR